MHDSAEIKKTGMEGQDGPVGFAAFKNNLTKIRTGRANPALLDSVHGRLLRQPDTADQPGGQCVAAGFARTISVQPWEKGMGPKIEKAIRESDLGLNPASMGDLIRVPMPADERGTPQGD